MAKKKLPKKTYCAVHAALVIFNVLCCTALIVLQNRCLNAQTDDFVESYCLSDNRMRAVVSFVLGILILIIAASLSRAVKSFRTYKLMSGINEGVFIALLSGFGYRLRAIRMKKWTAAILAVVLFQIGPPFWQTITQYAITTEDVFVREQGSKVTVFNRDINYNEGLNALFKLPRVLGTENLLLSIATFSNPQISKIAEGGVQTSVVRDALVTNISSSHAQDDFSFRYTDVVATVLTSCDIDRRVNTSFTDDGRSYVTKMLNGQGVAVRVNSSYTTEGNVAVISTEKKMVYCARQNTCIMTIATCKSKLSLAKENVIFTSSNRKVTSLRTVDENANVNLDRFTNMTSALVAAPERVAYTLTSISGGVYDSSAGTSAEPAIASAGMTINDVIGNISESIPGAVLGDIPNNRRLLGLGAVSDIEASFNYVVNEVLTSGRGIGLGLFRSQFENELHARVCAATAISLYNMWVASPSVTGGSFDSQSFPTEEAFNEKLQLLDLFTVIPQAYMPVYYVWIMAAFFGLSVLCLAIIDFASFSRSEVNVRENNELALLDNISNSFAAERRNHHLSNDADMQESISFEQSHEMYMRVEGVHPNERLVVEYKDPATPNLNIPQHDTPYL